MPWQGLQLLVLGFDNGLLHLRDTLLKNLHVRFSAILDLVQLVPIFG